SHTASSTTIIWVPAWIKSGAFCTSMSPSPGIGGRAGFSIVKPSLLKYLACPKCRADLHLEGEGVPEIDEGALRCAGCATRYQISRGIPRFPIADDARTSAVTTQTSKKYHFAWRRFGKAGHEKGWEKGSYRFTSFIPPELTSGPGRVGLDAGCGAGLDLFHIAAGGAEIIGIDVSTGIDV